MGINSIKNILNQILNQILNHLLNIINNIVSYFSYENFLIIYYIYIIYYRVNNTFA